ncbi:MAG: 6-bladed beta-propeller [Planctomycetota bacterium]|jgi:DNA-binding beta-propeller fold protein YncE
MAVKKKIFVRRNCGVQLSVLGLVMLSFCAGCDGRRDAISLAPDVALAWPEPPEAPRIRYLGAISTEMDLKRKVSWTEGLGELLFGKKKIGVLVAPYAVAVDRANRLFVSDTAGAAIHMFDMSTRRYEQFAEMADQERLLKPVGLAIVGNRIYVVDSVLRKVCVFNTKGEFLFSFGRERFTRPSGIAYRQDDETVYVVDTARHAIDVFTKGGKFIQQIGSRGLTPGMFNFPTHLWLDRRGYLYVSDTLNYRIQVFTDDRKFLTTFGRQGDRPGNFAHPCGVATDAFGNIYVTDRQFENVQIFDPQGQILMAFGEEGTQPGQFWLPAGIFIDERNRIYVADSFNKRIQVFELLE